MPTAVSMPRLGMKMEEGTVVEWPIAVGDPVEKGEIVLIIESEKAEVEVEAAGSGVFRHVFVEEGETVPCGELLAAITDDSDGDFDPEAFAEEMRAKRPAEDTPSITPSIPAVTALPKAPAGPARTRGRVATPAARKRAKELGLDLARVVGSGPGGRIVRDDVEDRLRRDADLVDVSDGVRLEVPTTGAGPDVVLLPGFGTDVSLFSSLTRQLGEDHRVRAVHHRGVAGSTPVHGGWTVEQGASDVAALASEPVHVIGASLGAAVALEFALTEPQRVKSLTLITPFVAASPRLEAVCRSSVDTARVADAGTLARVLLPWFFREESLESEADRRRFARGLRQSLSQVPVETLAAQADALHAWSGRRAAALSEVAVPTLVIGAADDLLTRDAAEIAAAIPGARHETVAGAGHAILVEQGAETSAAVVAHVRAAG